MILKRQTKIFAILLAAGTLTTGAAQASRKAVAQKAVYRPEPAAPPRLLLFVTIDQGRSEYLDRFRPVLTEGLKTILDRGVSFTNAHHRHAITATAPGHASLVTGLYPSRSGMVSNQWYDRQGDRLVNCVQDSDSPILPPEDRRSTASPDGSSSGRSPRNLLATTLFDWIKEQSPASQVFTASGKDRSAILTGGLSADAAFWYDNRTGQFVTSRYYMREYPPWVRRFHERRIADSYFGRDWAPLLVDPHRWEGLGIQELERGELPWSFPHPVGEAQFTPSPGFYDALFYSPFIDSYLVEFAQFVVETQSLGRDEHLDVLGLGFSAVDTVGHEYGPNSPEILDAFRRLDRDLGKLLRVLEERIGMQHIVITVSADHGAMPMPEYLKTRQEEGGRFSTDDVICFQSAEQKLDSKLGEEDWLLRDLYLNYHAMARRNLRRQEVETELAAIIGRCGSVRRVWTRSELELKRQHDDPFSELYRHSFHPERSPDLFVQLKEFHITRLRDGTTHGSPYTYDTHVPMVVVFPGIPPAVVLEPVQTVDLAPTLASLLGIPVPSGLDGVDRSHLLTRHASRITPQRD